MNENEPKSISQKRFIQSIEDGREDYSYIFLLGAGASINSGIPSAEKLIWDWKKDTYKLESPITLDNNELTEKNKNIIQKWLDKKGGYPKRDAPEEYSFYCDNRFLNKEERKNFFKRLVRDKTPSEGYTKLATLLEHQFSKIVLTTNFDSLTIEAVTLKNALYPSENAIYPSIVTCEKSSNINQSIGKRDFLYIALHGDYKYSKLLNTDNELDNNKDTFKPFLEDELKKQHLISIGYSGRDESLMNTLIKAYETNGIGNIFWCTIGEVPEKTKAYLKKISETRNVYVVKINDFDDLLKKIKTAYVKESKTKKSIEVDKQKDEFQNLSLDTTLVKSILLNCWDEEKQGDKSIIEEYFYTNYKNYITKIKDNAKPENAIFYFSQGKWFYTKNDKITNKFCDFLYPDELKDFKKLTIKVLSEKHPMFDLEENQRFAFAVYGKIPKYSDTLRKGIADSLALLVTYKEKLKKFNPNGLERIVNNLIHELLKDADWKLWASLNDVLPTLAEVSPDEFLNLVENALQQTLCPFDELYKQNSNMTNYMTGIYWALENLAWSEEYLTRVILILGELAKYDTIKSNWGNKPTNSIITTLLPWAPQTTGSLNKKVASLKGLQKHCPEIAWSILIQLLHKQTTISTPNHKPKYRKFIPDNWQEKVNSENYYKEIKEYTSLTIEMAKKMPKYIPELVNHLNNVIQPYFDDFLKHLSSTKVLNSFDDTNRQTIWKQITLLIKKHSCFPDASWALDKEQVKALEKIAQKIKPSKPEILYQHLFSNEDYMYFEGQNINYEIQEKNLKAKQTKALKKIYSIDKVNSIIKFSENVERPYIVGFIFSKIATNQDEKKILPVCLDNTDTAKKAFLQGYISRKFFKHSTEWLDGLNSNDWSINQKCKLLLALPFKNEIWEKADELLSNNVVNYWENVTVNPYVTTDIYLPAIENLLKYNRPLSAINCIYAHRKKNIPNELIIKALTTTKRINSEKNVKIESYHLTRIIKILQDLPETEILEDELAEIEWLYLPLLNEYNNAKPKILEKNLSQKPSFYVEVIQLVYSSNKEKINIDDLHEKMSKNGYTLLFNWKLPPGKKDDGTFSDNEFKKWYDKVEKQTLELNLFDVAMHNLGKVLFYAYGENTKDFMF